MRFILCFLLFMSCLIAAGTNAVSQESAGERTYKIVFIEFDDSSAGSFKYLKNSIQTMLASRLAANGNVVIIDQNVSAEQLNKLKQGNRTTLSAAGEAPDYLVEGTLFSLKGGLNTQVVLYPFQDSGKPFRFSILTQNTSTLISDIETLATDIGSDVFGVKKEIFTPGAPQGLEAGSAGFVTAHPEAAFKRKMYSGTVLASEEGDMEIKTIGGKKSTTLDEEMTTMTVADLDHDGQEEILVLFPSRLELYSAIDRKIVKKAEFKLPPDLNCHALNTADLNKNNIDEIYLSATRKLVVSSLVLTWTEQKFKILAENIPFYIRPVEIPGAGIVLAGQKKGLEKTAFLKPGLFVLKNEEGKGYGEGQPLAVPPSVNLFDFVFADLDGDKRQELVAIDRKERLKVYSPNNELLWVSKKSFGGSKIYLGPSMGDALNDNVSPMGLTADEEASRELSFVPGRLIALDVNNDGKSEIVISEQEGMTIPFFHRLRFYSSGAVVGMSWGNESLQEIWRTGNFSGYLAGYGLSDVSPVEGAIPWKSTVHLYIGQISDSGSLMALLPGSSKSELTIFEMQFSDAKKE